MVSNVRKSRTSDEEAAREFGVCARTIRRWAKKGKIATTQITPGKRDYNINKIRDSMCICGRRAQSTRVVERRDIIYARVSTRQQRPHLDTQVELMRERVSSDTEVITDIGSGLNFKRPGLNKVLEAIMRGEVRTVHVAYKDRLCRFAYDLIERICEQHGTKIEVAKHDDSETTPETELAEDVLSIITVFGARLYGKRSRDKRLRQQEQGPKNTSDGGDENDAGENPLLDAAAEDVHEAVDVVL